MHSLGLVYRENAIKQMTASELRNATKCANVVSFDVEYVDEMLAGVRVEQVAATKGESRSVMICD